jgi:hypothetical protein
MRASTPIADQYLRTLSRHIRVWDESIPLRWRQLSSSVRATFAPFSKRSRAYLFHLIPITVLIRWTITAAADTANTTTFSCTVATEIPTALRLPAQRMGLGYFNRKHLDETLGSAADISRKLPARQSR